MRGIFEALWSLLPDRCEMPNCVRSGIRGNENRVDGRIMCDACHARYILWRLRS
jgi:hypothetical protein